MTIHAVILNWNGGEATERCLRSLFASRNVDLVAHVVDNGSVDGSPERVRRDHPEVRLHAQPENLGYSVAANIGIRAALDEGAEFALLLNNDALLDEAALSLLVDAARRRPECGLYTGKIFRDRSRGILWSCGMTLGFGPNLAQLRGFGERDTGRYDREETMALVTGCALLVHRAVFERAGLLDPTYFVYVEDADFCARAGAAGFRPLYVPTALFEHPGSVSTGGGYSPVRKYLCAHGSVTWLRRHGSFRGWAALWICDVLLWPIVFVVALAKGDARGAFAKARGLLHGLLGRPADLSALKRPRRMPDG